MSGKASFIHLDGTPIELGLIEKMTAARSYRSPNHINHLVKGPPSCPRSEHKPVDLSMTACLSLQALHSLLAGQAPVAPASMDLFKLS